MCKSNEVNDSEGVGKNGEVVTAVMAATVVKRFRVPSSKHDLRQIKWNKEKINQPKMGTIQQINRKWQNNTKNLIVVYNSTTFECNYKSKRKINADFHID